MLCTGCFILNGIVGNKCVKGRKRHKRQKSRTFQREIMMLHGHGILFERELKGNKQCISIEKICHCQRI